ncbi:TetR/AcrR family transcriptional regulator [Microbacterium sp. NPDC091313]
MPKIVDHRTRREEILHATRRVIVRDGIDSTTIRQIAKEAECSAGALAHYFRDKSEILALVHRGAFSDVAERAERRNAGVTGVEALRNALYEALPLDEHRREEALLDANLWTAAGNDPALRAVRHQSVVNARPWWTRMLNEGRVSGEITTECSNAILCDRIMALIDGASVAMLLYADDLDAARIAAMADAFIADISR